METLILVWVSFGDVAEEEHWGDSCQYRACPPVLLIIFRLCLPETQAFQRRMALRQKGDDIGRTFIREGRIALRRYWLLLIYLVLL